MSRYENLAAAREVRTFLASNVRNDFRWLPGSDIPDTASYGSSTTHDSRPFYQYQERHYGSSTDSSEGAEEAGETDHLDEDEAAAAAAAAEGRKEKADEFRREERKRRRGTRLREEMVWNEGLRNWTLRRDAWTQARPSNETSLTTKRLDRDISPGSTTDAKGAASPQSTTPHDSATGSLSPHTQSPTTHPAASRAATPSSPVPSTTSSPESEVFIPPYDVSLPIVPRILPHNPIRTSIGPSTYPEIYNKIVSSSRTPSVPINLKDMTRALVQGWQTAGEWPPKPSIIEPPTASRRNRIRSKVSDCHLRGGDGPDTEHKTPRLGSLGGGATFVEKVKEAKPAKRRKSSKALNDKDDEEKGRNGMVLRTLESLDAEKHLMPDDPLGGGSGLLSHHPHIRRSLDGVKRVLGLGSGSESGSLPGSRRGSVF